MRKSKKYADIFASGAFLLFLGGAMLVTLCKPKESYSYFENRNLAEFPTLSRERLSAGEWGSEFDRYLADHAAGRNTMLKADTFLNTYILRRPLVNEIIVADPYLLPELKPESKTVDQIPGDVAALTENLVSLSELTERYGGHYYYAAVPSQYVFHEDDYPWYTNNRSEYTEQSVAALRDSLENAGVGFIDLGELFSSMGWPDELSSAIDNHNSMMGAYLTYETIMDRINADTGLDLPILREGEFTLERLENRYLGSRMRKLMGLWESDEKLYLFQPNEPIPFTRKDNGAEVPPTVYALPATPEEDVLYSLYMGGDIALTEIDTNREELPSILIYGDSFTNAAECIFYNSFNKMYSIDLRHYTEMSLGDFIQKHQPDIVVCIRDYGVLIDPTNNGRGAELTAP